MQRNPKELEFLSAWAREKSARSICPSGPSTPGRPPVRGVTLIRASRTGARAEGRRDEDIFTLCDNPNPPGLVFGREMTGKTDTGRRKVHGRRSARASHRDGTSQEAGRVERLERPDSPSRSFWPSQRPGKRTKGQPFFLYLAE